MGIVGSAAKRCVVAAPPSTVEALTINAPLKRMQLDASNAAPARTTVALGEITMFVTLSDVYWYANCITALVLAGKWTVSLAVGSAGVQHAALVTLMILHTTTNVTFRGEVVTLRADVAESCSKNKA